MPEAGIRSQTKYVRDCLSHPTKSRLGGAPGFAVKPCHRHYSHGSKENERQRKKNQGPPTYPAHRNPLYRVSGKSWLRSDTRGLKGAGTPLFLISRLASQVAP